MKLSYYLNYKQALKAVLLCLLLSILQFQGAFAQDSFIEEADSLMLPLRSGESNTEQLSPIEQYIPPTPQAAALARYGEYPVSLATGIPEIDIPLYEIKLGSFTLPISISYHASGIKVDDVASTVGLGWVLNAGGVVCRTICGAPDLRETYNSHDYYYRSLAHVQEIQGQASSSGQNGTLFAEMYLRPLECAYDTQSDKYSYNFGNFSGVFRFSHEHQEFISLNHPQLYIYGQGGPNSYFYISDINGIEYEFREHEWTGVPTDENTTDICAWYLTKIKTPNGDITFTYQRASSDITLYQSYQTTRIGASPSYALTEPAAVLASSSDYIDFSATLFRQKILKKIEWSGNHIDFTYSNDRSDIAPDRLVKMEVVGMDGTLFKTVTFNNNNYYGNDAYNKRMMLASVSLSDEGTYSFGYNTSHGYLPGYKVLYNRYKHNTSDFWGYYNGTYTEKLIPADVLMSAYGISGVTLSPSQISYMTANAAIKSVNFNYMKCGILESIAYPTGGDTHYEYEANGSGTSCGGLHVKTITDYADNASIPRIRRYSYVGIPTHDPVERMMIYKDYRIYQNPYFPAHELCNTTTCTSIPLLPLGNGSGSPVLFHTVSETTEEGAQTIGRVQYSFSNGMLYDYYQGETVLLGGQYPGFCWSGINDEGNCTPMLTEKIYYDSDGETPLKTETYNYQSTNIRSFSTGVKIVGLISPSSLGMIPAYYSKPYVDYRETTAHCKAFSLLSKTTTDHQTGFSTTESYTYDSQFRTPSPKTIATTNSDGKVFKTVYRYGFECCDSLNIGINENIPWTDQIVSTRQYSGSTLLKTDSTKFVKVGAWYHPEYSYESRLGNPLTEKVHFADYDTYGHPQTIILNQTDTTALIWGFKSSLLGAKVRGYSYSQVNNLPLNNKIVSAIQYQNNPSLMESYLASLRSNIGTQALVTTYNHKPLFGISAITAENGYTLNYAYGSDGHLSAISDNDGPLQQFSYQYVHPYSGGPNTTNYVQTQDMLSTNTGKITREYYDGLGRPVETARNVAGSYVYTLQKYDKKGRISEEWIPAVGSSSPDFLSSISSISASTHGDTRGFKTHTYDALDRLIFTATPGDDWGGIKGVTKEYLANAANSVNRYQAPLGGDALNKLGTYAANMLSAEKTTDEDGHTLTVFSDKLGRKVLERRGTSNDTYYIYDDLSQLRFVLSPEYQNSGYKSTYGYEYRYDAKGRLAKKILPQCEYTQYWYDTAGRMKFMQDATLRSRGLYRFMLYDKYGRLCIQGICTNCWRGETVNTATYNTSGTGFQNTGYQLGRDGDISGTVTLELVNYYDNYDFIRLYNSSLQTSSSATTTSLQTGSIRKASDGSTLAAALYYDYKGRPVNTRSISLGNRLTTVATSYKYWGDVYQTVQTDYPTTNTLIAANLVSTTTNNYNASTGLLTNTTLTLKAGYGSAVTKTIQALTYDGLGRIVSNTRSGSAGAVAYNYNLHNWVTEINGLGFHEWLNYADGTNPLYNGNISTQKWQVSNESFNRGYRFTYNALNWLTEAVYGEQNFQKNDNDYNEKVLEYSANGMMKRFQRRGLKDDGDYGKIDNLHISLNGNRPHSITDDADPQTVYGAMEFNDGSNSGQEYFYDACGSLVADANKGIAHIDYDNCNYPKEIQFTNGNTIQYVYTPDGQKLRTKYQTAVDNIVVPLNTTTTLSNSQIVNTTQTDYVGNVIYTGMSSGASTTTSLNKCLFAGGYATFSNNVPTYHYYTQDHLGNNRAVVNDNGTVEQITHYYPFGGTYADVGLNSGLQPYKYNGKELDRMHGLNLYDYGARHYDAIVPMFTQIDPLAEKYYNFSPYVYCGNNPIINIDPTGKEKIDALDPDDKENKNLKLAITNFKDEKNVINIWAHGSSSSMTVYDNQTGENKRISDAKGFRNFLDQNSNVWENHKKGDQITIVLHSCETGLQSKDKNSFAQKISSSLKDAVVIAPEQAIYAVKGEEKGTYFKSVESTKDFNNSISRWIQYEKGEKTNDYKGNSLPGSTGFKYVTNQSPWYDKLLNLFGL